jgi:hypothetical protein
VRHLIARFVMRGLLRLALITAMISAIGSVSFLFGWMSPSLRAAETAVWQRIDANTAVSWQRNDGDCVAIYQSVAVTAGNPPRYAFPDLLVGQRALDLLGLPGPSLAFELDSLAATALHVSTGTEVEVQVRAAPALRGLMYVSPLPTKLRQGPDGAIAVREEPSRFEARYGIVPDSFLCLGGTGDTTAGQTLQAIERRQDRQGLTSSATAFGLLAVAAAAANIIILFVGGVRRRRSSQRLLVAAGVHPVLAALGPLIDLLGAALLSLAAAAVLALWVRTSLLGMWTDPSLVMWTVLLAVPIVAVLWAAIAGSAFVIAGPR